MVHREERSSLCSHVFSIISPHNSDHCCCGLGRVALPWKVCMFKDRSAQSLLSIFFFFPFFGYIFGCFVGLSLTHCKLWSSILGGVLIIGGLYCVLWGKSKEVRHVSVENVASEAPKDNMVDIQTVWQLLLQSPVRLGHWSLLRSARAQTQEDEHQFLFMYICIQNIYVNWIKFYSLSIQMPWG